MTDIPPQPQPAYGVIKARRDFRDPRIALAAGDVLIDIRARAGISVLEWFKKALGWSAFTVEIIDGPPAPPPSLAPPSAELIEMAERTISTLNAEIAELKAQLAAVPPSVDLGTAADPIGAIAAATSADLKPLPGIGEKRAVELIEAARALVAARTPPPPAKDH